MWVGKALMRGGLKNEIANLEREEMQITQTLDNLADFANSIGDGTLTMSELTSTPSSLFGNAMNYLANSTQMAYQSATMKTNALLQQLAQADATTGNQYGHTMNQAELMQYNAPAIFNDIFQEELKEYAKQYQDYLSDYEQELETEKTRVETRLQTKRIQLQSYEQAVAQGIQDSAPRFV